MKREITIFHLRSRKVGPYLYNPKIATVHQTKSTVNIYRSPAVCHGFYYTKEREKRDKTTGALETSLSDNRDEHVDFTEMYFDNDSNDKNQQGYFRHLKLSELLKKTPGG